MKGLVNSKVMPRRPGRPRAIPANMIPEVTAMYLSGLGYRAIARELGKQGIQVNWSTVRRVIKANPRDEG